MEEPTEILSEVKVGRKLLRLGDELWCQWWERESAGRMATSSEAGSRETLQPGLTHLQADDG